MDDRNAEQLLYIDATLAEMIQLASRGRQAYDSDIAVSPARASTTSSGSRPTSNASVKNGSQPVPASPGA